MTPYFHSPERIENLRTHLQAWETTPYVDYKAIRGAGGDCLRTVAAVLAECGWQGTFSFPEYATAGDAPDRLCAELDRVPELLRIDAGTLAPGDVLAAMSKQTRNPHLALYEGDDFCWHMSCGRAGWCRRHRQVAMVAWELLAVFRPMEAPCREE